MSTLHVARAAVLAALRETGRPLAAAVSTLPIAGVVALLVFAVAFVFVLVAATVVHLALRRSNLPRICLLPLFLAIGYGAGVFAGGDSMPVVPIAILISLSAWGCTRSDATAIDPNTIEAKYGLTGAHVENVMTPDGPMGATIVPITMGNGQRAELVIPNKAAGVDHPAYIRDDKGLHPIALNNPRTTTRAEMVRSGPAVVESRPVVTKKKRSWEKEALIIGGSAGAGAAIGGIAGGGKGAAIGATAGGVGGLIYDVLTRNK